jgi:excisionase family DNA binding protein
MSKPAQHRGQPFNLSIEMATKGYITVKVAAAMLRQSMPAVYRLLDAGIVKGVRFGRTRYVERASLLVYIGPDGVKLLGISAA